MTNPTPPTSAPLPAFHILDVVPSTHTLACDLARSHAPHGEALIARAQTEGRGRMGRTWRSPADLHHLYLSIITRFPWPLPELAKLPLLAGLWMAETIHQETQSAARVSLKWPNDLIIHGRKLGGILCECLTPDDPAQPNTPAVDRERRPQPRRLQHRPLPRTPPPRHYTRRVPLPLPIPQRAGHHRRTPPPNRTHLPQQVSSPTAPRRPPANLRDQWLAWSCLPSRVRLEDGSEGTATSLDPSGALRVELLHGGVSSVHAGELHWIELAAQYRP